MAPLSYTSFKPLVNNTFKVKLAEPILELGGLDAGPTELTLELVEVEERNNERCEGFSLIFHGPAHRLLPQKLYSLSHATLGDLQIFLVPVGEKVEGEEETRKTVGYQYQAVFSRLKEQQ